MTKIDESELEPAGSEPPFGESYRCKICSYTALLARLSQIQNLCKNFIQKAAVLVYLTLTPTQRF